MFLEHNFYIIRMVEDMPRKKRTEKKRISRRISVMSWIDTFLLERLFRNYEVPIYVENETGEWAAIPLNCNGRIPYLCDRSLLNRLKEIIKSYSSPIICFETGEIYYGIFADEKGTCYIWGPAALHSLEGTEEAAYRNDHNIKDKNYKIHRYSQGVIANLMAIAFAYYTGRQVTEEEIETVWCSQENQDVFCPEEIERYELDKFEDNRIHDSVEWENRFVTAVEEGDVSSLKWLLQFNQLEKDNIGRVAETSLKQMEYLCVSSVTLVSRAAIRGGMNPERAHDLSDLYLQKIAKCKTIEEMAALTGKMQYDYTQQVYKEKIKRKGNLYVEKCKDYIAKNLRKSFQVHEIAEELHANRTYLSRVFSEQEGISIQEYVTKERCEHAANMLKYTDYSIAVIAEYFCFSTQSHFGKQFKKVYGMTPKEYRKANRYIGSFFKGEF